ncbi:hypothetical protein XENORESO_009725 [Xenotaenia resolanae]|uniref:Uncharacterized protein n=1 Tax=Xenotaenia resolanae TaxID=208358 RepID=A0ABV0WXX7_9TELE
MEQRGAETGSTACRVFTFKDAKAPQESLSVCIPEVCYCSLLEITIHPVSTPACLCRVKGTMVTISSGHWAGGGVHSGQVASPSQGHRETNRTNNHTVTP